MDVSTRRRAAQVHLTIDKLVLRDFPAGDSGRVAAEFQAALVRLLADPAEFGASRHVPALRNATTRTDAGRAGPVLARQLVGGLRR